MEKPTEKELWMHYRATQEDLYSILDEQHRLYVYKSGLTDDLKYSRAESLFNKEMIEAQGGRYEILNVPRYPHAVIMLDNNPHAKRAFLQCKEELERIYEDIKGTKYRRKHPKYIEGPKESVKISEKSAVASVAITPDAGSIALGTLKIQENKELEELTTRCVHAGLPISIEQPRSYDDLKDLSFPASVSGFVVHVKATDLLAFAKAKQLQRRITTGPQIVAHIRRPEERAMRVPAGLIVIDYQDGLRATPTETRKRRADHIYTAAADTLTFDPQIFEPIKIAGTFYRR